MKKTNLLIVLLSATGIMLSACSSTPSDNNASVENRDNIATVNSDGFDSNGLPNVLTDPNNILSQRSIYFDLDRYDVKEEYRDVLTAHSQFLKQNRGFKMLIQGNTDERGSSEYNLSLGQRRAEAVRRSLSLMGVSDEQLEAVSLGKEKPRNPGHNEEAWAENRRSDMLYRAPDGRGEF